jgi:hypothetical protein
VLPRVSLPLCCDVAGMGALFRKTVGATDDLSPASESMTTGWGQQGFYDACYDNPVDQPKSMHDTYGDFGMDLQHLQFTLHWLTRQLALLGILSLLKCTSSLTVFSEYSLPQGTSSSRP